MRGKGLSHRSLVYTLGALRQVFAYGARQSVGALPFSPAAAVKTPRRGLGDKRSILTWEPQELVRFRSHLDTPGVEPWARAAFRLSLSGLRRSEILGLSWSAVDLDAGSVRIEASRVSIGNGRTERDNPKSDASRRTVPVEQMNPGTIAVLRTLKANQAADRLAAGTAYSNPEDLVVVDGLGNGLGVDAYSDEFRSLCRSSGVPPIRLHSIRHGIALGLHRAGVAPSDAAELLGHTVNTHLTVYLPKSDRGSRSAATAFGDVFAAAE